MSAILLAFGLFESAAFAAFLWIPLPIEGRTPGNLLPWTAGSIGCFYLFVWPALVVRIHPTGSERALTHFLAEVGEHSLMILAAGTPFFAAAAVLEPPGRGALAAASVPALGCLLAGTLFVLAARLGDPEILRPATALAAAAVATGPLGQFLSGASGSLPENIPPSIFSRPSWALTAIAFPVGVILLARLRTGSREAAP